MDEKYLCEEGYAFMGASFEVYNELGYGLSEEIYQQGLEIELGLQGIPFQSKTQLNVFYKNRMLDKKYIPDLFAYNEIIAELKSVKELLPEHEAQLINYMRITKKAVGYLINFGHAQSLQWKRYILKEFIPKKISTD